jgi:ligand-binding SRPBCC domain-containing protein
MQRMRSGYPCSSMFVIKDHIHINAPIERCFLLSTSIDLVARTLSMKAIAGKTSGLIVANDRLTWSGWKFGLPQRHETLITQYNAPIFFQDSMASGRFRIFRHDHEFTEVGGQTLLKDIVRFLMPLGPAGKLAGKYILVPHIRNLLRRRFALLKHVAETEEWLRYLPQA